MNVGETKVMTVLSKLGEFLLSRSTHYTSGDDDTTISLTLNYGSPKTTIDVPLGLKIGVFKSDVAVVLCLNCSVELFTGGKRLADSFDQSTVGDVLLPGEILTISLEPIHRKLQDDPSEPVISPLGTNIPRTSSQSDSQTNNEGDSNAIMEEIVAVGCVRQPMLHGNKPPTRTYRGTSNNGVEATADKHGLPSSNKTTTVSPRDPKLVGHQASGAVEDCLLGKPEEGHVGATISRLPSFLREGDFVDPIMLIVMADPVTCDDGYTYERSVIEKHFQTRIEAEEARKEATGRRRRSEQEDDDSAACSSNRPVIQLTSPSSGAVISSKLVPNRHLERQIVRLVENNALNMSQEDIDDWRRRRKEKCRLEKTRRDAEAADFLRQKAGRQASPRQNVNQARIARNPNSKKERLVKTDTGLAVELCQDDEIYPAFLEVRPNGARCMMLCCAIELKEYHWCRRCGRVACLDCLKFAVTDITEPNSTNAQNICFECASDILERINAQNDETNAIANRTKNRFRRLKKRAAARQDRVVRDESLQQFRPQIEKLQSQIANLQEEENEFKNRNQDTNSDDDDVGKQTGVADHSAVAQSPEFVSPASTNQVLSTPSAPPSTRIVAVEALIQVISNYRQEKPARAQRNGRRWLPFRKASKATPAAMKKGNDCNWDTDAVAWAVHSLNHALDQGSTLDCGVESRQEQLHDDDYSRFNHDIAAGILKANIMGLPRFIKAKFASQVEAALDSVDKSVMRTTPVLGLTPDNDIKAEHERRAAAATPSLPPTSSSPQEQGGDLPSHMSSTLLNSEDVMAIKSHLDAIGTTYREWPLPFELNFPKKRMKRKLTLLQKSLERQRLRSQQKWDTAYTNLTNELIWTRDNLEKEVASLRHREREREEQQRRREREQREQREEKNVVWKESANVEKGKKVSTGSV